MPPDIMSITPYPYAILTCDDQQAPITGIRLHVLGEHAVQLHLDGDVASENPVASLTLKPRDARALGQALLALADSLSWQLEQDSWRDRVP